MQGEILGAHAIVGVDIDYMEFLGKYLMVVMNGTAVHLKDFQAKQVPDNFMMPVEKADSEKK